MRKIDRCIAKGKVAPKVVIVAATIEPLGSTRSRHSPTLIGYENEVASCRQNLTQI